MKEIIIQSFEAFPPEWAVFFLSMVPITELRAAIPIGIEAFELPVIQTWIIAVVGNMIPTIFLLALLPYLHDWVLQQKFLGRVLKKKMQDAEKYFSGNHAKYGALALVLFVGIPLPLTGAWTGSLAAFIFNIRFKQALPLIFAGVCTAATVVTILTLGVGGVFRIFI